MRIRQLKTEYPKSAHNHYWFWLIHGCFSLNIQNIKNDGSLFSLRNIKIMQKISLDSGTIEEITRV